MTSGITWRPGFGDTNLAGWAITIAYALSSAICFTAALSIRQVPANRRHRPALPWFVLSALLLLLGINKQLDLQTLLLQLGRSMAETTGWHAQRRSIQAVFAVTAAIAGALGLGLWIWRQQRFFKTHPLILPGGVLLLLYLVLRVAAINHLDQQLGVNIEPRRWLAGIEFSGILCLAGAGVYAMTRTPE